MVEISKTEREAIGNRLREVRIIKNCKQREFANALWTSVVTMSEVENGKKKPGFDLLYNLSKVYNVSLEYMIHGEGPMFRDEKPVPPCSSEEDISSRFGDSCEDIKHILYVMEHSRLALSAITAFAKEYLYKNESMIKTDMRVTEERKKRK